MIAHTIQLALAPVFVLVAIGNIMNILSSRLGRIVDRARTLQRMHGETKGAAHDRVVLEMRSVDQRIELNTRAIKLLVMAGLAIGTTVAVLFVEEIFNVPVERIAAGIFLLAISLLMWGLWLFLRETQVAAEILRIPEDYLESHREL
ncbi:DUF2721 domain-containing protein [Novosphingobium umbonatum]|uniref:DUF2721 domain-containing protein n=1 Tax=Novosphingobium umbonatum TaxID=1908524 RepID=A0A437N5W7_9SPHN|nr:DUF2721 domain-containing protein [Novosphingobium umbonatum]RVU05313.1 DUF2721 domain-containing protein [Novosphingobium umbonatum]